MDTQGRALQDLGLPEAHTGTASPRGTRVVEHICLSERTSLDGGAVPPSVCTQRRRLCVCCVCCWQVEAITPCVARAAETTGVCALSRGPCPASSPGSLDAHVPTASGLGRTPSMRRPGGTSAALRLQIAEHFCSFSPDAAPGQSLRCFPLSSVHVLCGGRCIHRQGQLQAHF